MSQRHTIFIICFTFFIIYTLFYIRNIRFSTSDRPSAGSIWKGLPSHSWLILDSNSRLSLDPISSTRNVSVIITGKNLTLTQQSKNMSAVYTDSQLRSDFGFRSTNQKMIAYLLAIKYGANHIYEYSSNVSFRFHSQQDIEHIAFRRQRSPFVNIYPTFTANFTFYSPGLPKDELTNITQDGWSSIRKVDQYQETVVPLIQQQILVGYTNDSLSVNHPPIAVEPFTFAPFSAENIIFSYDAFWGLVLFQSKSEIWRSWWVQRLLWDINGYVVFASTPFKSNIETTLNIGENVPNDKDVGKLVRYLNEWKSTKPTLVERIKQLINDLIKENFCDVTELKVIQDWIDDLKQINYVFPSINTTTSTQKSSQPVRRRRTAVCLTGLIECIEEAWKPTARAIRSHIQGEMDVFMYLSSTEPVVDQISTVPLHNRLVEVLRYTNYTVRVLFENIPKLDPHFPPNCTNDESVNQPPHKIPRYYQQLFGLSNCFALVRDYETKHNIKYDVMVRSRADIEFLKIPSTFERSSPFDINTTMILPPNRFGSRLDDGFAVGPIDAIKVYMNRYFSFQQCLTPDLHPERYLDFYLNHRKVNMTVDIDSLLVGHIPHAPNHCH